jgi:hypothetical protein
VRAYGGSITVKSICQLLYFKLPANEKMYINMVLKRKIFRILSGANTAYYESMRATVTNHEPGLKSEQMLSLGMKV